MAPRLLRDGRRLERSNAIETASVERSSQRSRRRLRLPRGLRLVRPRMPLHLRHRLWCPHPRRIVRPSSSARTGQRSGSRIATSPANILIEQSGHVKLHDFGIARMADDEFKTQDGTFRGTLSYAAPETLQGIVASPRSDLYMASVILYQLLSGTNPFFAEQPSGTLHRVMKEVPRGSPLCEMTCRQRSTRRSLKAWERTLAAGFLPPASSRQPCVPPGFGPKAMP